MSETRIIGGIEFAAHRQRIFKEDWQKEQSAIGQAIADRDQDAFGSGVHSGGTIAVSATPSAVDLTAATIAYDDEGRRIEAAATNGILLPADSAVTIILRHQFTTTEFTSPDNSEDPADPVEHKDDGFEITYRVGALSAGDVALRAATIDAGGVVTLGADLRSWRGLAGRQIADNAIETRHYSDGSIGDDAITAESKIGVAADLRTRVAAAIVGDFNVIKAVNRVDELLEALETLFAQEKKFLGEVFALDDYVPPSAAFPAHCISEADTTIDVENWPPLHAHLYSKLYRYDPTGTNQTDFPVESLVISSNTLTWTMQNTPANMAILTVLAHDQLFHGSFVNWRTLTWESAIAGLAPATVAITGINVASRTISAAYVAPNASGAATGNLRFYPHRIAGSTTLCRHFRQDGLSLFSVGNPDSEWGVDFRRQDQFQGHRMSPLDPMTHFLGPGPNNSFISTASGGQQRLTTGDPVTDGVNGNPRTGSRTHGPGVGAYFYRWGRLYLPS